jgi:peptide/nickel transport system permease protein
MRGLWRIFARNRIAVMGLILILIIVFIAVFSPFLAPSDPIDQKMAERLTGPMAEHLMGTDDFGRDILSRTLYGTRISLLVGVLSIALAVVVGIMLGIYAGFKGGMFENVIMRGTDILMSFPSLVMGLMVVAVLGSGLIKLILALGIVFTPRVIRIAHGPTLSLKALEFIDAAKALGLSDWRIVTKHLLPNVLGEVFVMGTLWIGTAIRIEASLSFLGLGVSPPTPTWGNMIRGGLDYLAEAPWISLFPGIAILITVLAFNLLGDGIRDIIDPRLVE